MNLASHRRRLVITLVLAGLACAAFAAPALAAQAWRIDSLSNTTVAPGGTLEYLVQLNNIGDAPMDGSEIAIVARLPDGMTALDAFMLANLGSDTVGTPCAAGDGVSPVGGASVVKCVNSVGLGAADFQMVRLSVSVDPLASGTLTSSFEITGGGAGPASTVNPTLVTTSGPPGFGLDAIDGQFVDAAGSPVTQAGAHPATAMVSIDFNTSTNPLPLGGIAWPVEPVKDVIVDLPPGLVGDPTALDRCTAAQLANSVELEPRPLCPATSQVGTTLVRTNSFPLGKSVLGPLPVFNLVPPAHSPARFGFNVAGTVVVLDGALRSGGDYGLSIESRNVSEALSVSGTTFTFWGVPSDPVHDFERACPGGRAPSVGGPACPSGGPRVAFFRNPTSCPVPGVGLLTSVHIDSWMHPGAFETAAWESHLPPAYPAPPSMWGVPIGTTGCMSVPFTPDLAGTPVTSRANSPSAFAFDLSIPQTDDPEVLGQSDLQRAVVTLPAGVRVSPSAAGGLQACTPGQIRLDDGTEPTCPDASKVGSVTIETPLLDEPLSGSIYLAQPNDNPFGTLLSIYLVARGPGVVVKLPGKVEPDGSTGQLTATFDDNPQLPFSNLHLQFDGGPRAQLVTPKTCGTYTTHAVLTGWNGRTVESDSTFTISGDGHGAACPPSQFTPDFAAGTRRPVAGASSEFNLRISRDDADEELKSVTVDLPSGLTGKIANASLCSAGDARASTCPDGSRIGSIVVGAGAGSNPFYITNGRAYLTGPYKGAPFGLSLVVPAVAGPFDLGNVTVRSALFVDKHTADVSVVSDPLPTILQGIPLDVRDVRVKVDKPDFFINPTSCEEKTIRGTIGSVDGKTANVSSRFEVGECRSLALKPRMALTVGGRGATGKGSATAFATTLRMTPGQTNLRSVRVTLPTTLNARLTVINDACTREEFERADCAHARAGTAVAKTPLLADPLRGNVYFVKNGHPLPDLFVSLRGQVAFDLIGRITIPGSKRLRTTFASVPDVPISSFSLRLVGGRDASIGAAANLCSSRSRRQKVELDFVGQNGRVRQVDQRLNVRGCRGHGRRR